MLEAPIGRAKGWIEKILSLTRVSEEELQRPRALTPIKVIVHTLLPLFTKPYGLLLVLGFVLLMAWGHHGNLHVIRGIEGLESLGLPLFWEGWGGAGSDPAARDQIID